MSKIVQFRQKSKQKYTVAIIQEFETNVIVKIDLEEMMEHLNVPLNTLISYLYILKTAKFLRLE